MTSSEIVALLDKVRSGALDVAEAASRLTPAVAEIGFAHVDLDRKARCGFPEVIYCEGKTCEWVVGVVNRLVENRQDCLATRVNADQSEALTRHFPRGIQDRLARTFWLVANEAPAPRGSVVVVTAGTSDLPVAQEAVVTAQALGCRTSLIADVGVAGIHRLLRKRDQFKAASVIVVVAGMDGALPSVIGGLVDCPVVAVPTSVGYGASFGGISALLTMLNACPANVAVVNIDSGFKGGYVAAMIARRTVESPTE